MATISHIPNPIAISVKTAGYTIPANRYARAVVNLEGTATFTIDAVTALRGTQNSVLGSSAMDGSLANVSEFGINVQTSTASWGGAAAFTSATDQKTVVQDFFLPSGTVINGTGTWRAVVEEYGG